MTQSEYMTYSRDSHLSVLQWLGSLPLETTGFDANADTLEIIDGDGTRERVDPGERVVFEREDGAEAGDIRVERP